MNKKTAGLANKISVATTFISLVLALFTYLLFLKTGEANDTSKSALEEAQRANDISENVLNDFRQRNIQEDALNKVLSERNRIKDSTSLNLTQQTIQAQINSIKETQRQFEIENMPYLQCGDFTFVVLEPDKPPKIGFYLINFGKTPAKIIRNRLGFFYAPSAGVSPMGYISQLCDDPIPTWSYITNQYPRLQIFTAHNPIPKAQLDAAKNNAVIMIMCGEIEYTNESNLKRRILRFNAIIYPPPSKKYKIVYLENIDVS